MVYVLAGDAGDAGGEGATRRLLDAVANAPPEGRLGAELGYLARLTAAARDLDSGRLKDAIAGYLRVPAESGYYRAARFGLATCQLRAGRAERALKILALLPGGLVGDPERAVVAAMAAHSVGKAEAAVAVIDGALARAGAWDEAAATSEAILARIAEGPAGPRTEGLVETVAGSASVRRLAAELMETRAELERGGAYADGLARYAERVEAALEAVIASDRAYHAARVARAWDNLRALRPQIAGPMSARSAAGR
ncbi:MAG: hypothetical protein CSA24_00095 [Deltaproteobacteria bacterium]|nr:MAG: hypothetical protein CSA24_00095 [Deltaproteobacteria bacterium]